MLCMFWNNLCVRARNMVSNVICIRSYNHLWMQITYWLFDCIKGLGTCKIYRKRDYIVYIPFIPTKSMLDF